MTMHENLAATEAIKRLAARRVRAIDMRDWATYADCHAPDHVSHGSSFAPPPGRAAMIEALRRVYEGISSIHTLHSPDIELLSADEARGMWGMADRLYWLEDGTEHRAFGWGFYHETYRRDDGNWRFTSRKLDYIRREFSPGQTRFA